jgi:hypothetical protein
VNLHRNEAAVALASIDAASARSAQLQHYRRFSPHLILWGAIWVVANTLSDLAPERSGIVWLVMSLGGMGGSYWLGARCSAALAQGGATRSRRDQSWRWLLCFLVIVAFQCSLLAILPALDIRQRDVFASLFWTFLYMGAGVWLGWRLFAIGLLASALVLLGYYDVQRHFFLYMGWVSGIALIAGGLWLRRL